MTQATRVHSTPPTNTSKIDPPVDPTRRRLLTIAAGGAVAIAIATPAIACLAEPDPIFAAIEKHQAAVRAVNAAGAEIDRLIALADAAVGPRSIEVPNMLEPGSPTVTVSCWVDIEKYVSPETDAELYAHYRSILDDRRDAHAAYLEEIGGDIDEMMDGPAADEYEAADELTEMMPTSLPGLFAVLIYINTAMTTKTEHCSASFDDNNMPALFESLAAGAAAFVQVQA
jgi:hypothetical protein